MSGDYSQEGAQVLWNPLSWYLGRLSKRGDVTTLLASVSVDGHHTPLWVGQSSLSQKLEV